MSDTWKTVKPYFNGGMSGMLATCCIQPIDMVKVRIQLGATGSPIGIASQIIKEEGFGSLYKGLSAGLLRQATYTTTRMGIFNNLNTRLQEMNKGNENGGKVPIWQNAVAGQVAGGIGAVVGNPADLSLIRMQADGTLPPEKRRGYKNVGDAFVRIVREEGFGGLFKGCGPTVVRAMALNMGMFASNEFAKDAVESMGMAKGTTGNNLTAALVSGFFASACSLPFDYVKTQIQKMQPLPDGTMPYKGLVDCAVQTVRQHGPLRFYKGFPTFYVRIGPHVTLTLLFATAIADFEKSIGL